MPRGDGLGPPSGGRRGKGMMGGPLAAGPGGQCVCPQCKTRVPHLAGRPCYEINCPECGTRMIRE
ncbi:MAG: hypothetical protein JXO49_04635 [Deltaproteobacteria bacterium]|nr:hypothetical protein [Candidatus Anaeroferrophillus wilburensis]MBN2888615.1 hypothetical protein [Deltaproteobacteria bacterium]